MSSWWVDEHLKMICFLCQCPHLKTKNSETFVCDCYCSTAQIRRCITVAAQDSQRRYINPRFTIRHISGTIEYTPSIDVTTVRIETHHPTYSTQPYTTVR